MATKREPEVWGAFVGPLRYHHVTPGQDVTVRLGAVDRKAVYIGRNGSSCDGSLVIHVKDLKSGKTMAVKPETVRPVEKAA